LNEHTVVCIVVCAFQDMDLEIVDFIKESVFLGC